ncbi:MAG TPA: DUF402 domain-containing protein [Thermomicrobiales bacterium]|nr:DUF402 domain-containing protein [Thermomicrobiales bacterium]
MSDRPVRMFYRKEKLRGACWEYQIQGGWITVPCAEGARQLLTHRFAFYRPREMDVRTPRGVERLSRAAAEQWFFPDRWFSILRFTTCDDRTVGYYVNFSCPLIELRANYYRDLDLELDLWVEPDGTVTVVDQLEYDAAIEANHVSAEWAAQVNCACEAVSRAVREAVAAFGPDIDRDRHPEFGVPRFILRA